MRGILFAILGGAFLTLQGVANARISQDIGTWQAATLTQLTGFLTALVIAIFVKDNWRQFKLVRPVYLTGGAFAAVIIFSNVTAIHLVGVTLTVSTVLIAQLAITFLIDSRKQPMRLPQFVGLWMMIAGVVILRF